MAAGERIVAFARPGKPPKKPFWSLIERPPATPKHPDFRLKSTVSKA
jgi:hypothetical protein